MSRELTTPADNGSPAKSTLYGRLTQDAAFCELESSEVRRSICHTSNVTYCALYYNEQLQIALSKRSGLSKGYWN